MLLIRAFCIFALSANGEQSSVGKNRSTIINSEGLPSYIIDQLIKISISSGETRVTISSKQRSVRKQVEVMLDYYINCSKITDVDDKKDCGLDLAKNIYDKDCHGGFDVFDKNESRYINIEKMTKALTEALLELDNTRHCMNHVVIPNIQTSIIAVDIKPSSITNHSKIYESVKKNEHVILFYDPKIDGKPKSKVKDATFHLGFNRQ